MNRTDRQNATTNTGEQPVPSAIWIAAVVGASVVFVFDLITPLGIAGGAPYVVLLLLGLWTRSRTFVVVSAVAALALTGAGMLLSPPGVEHSTFIANRVVTGVAITVCAAMVLYQQSLGGRLRGARREVRAGEEQHKAILEDAVEGIITINERGIIQSANKAARGMFGYAEAEIFGKNVSMLMPSSDREQHDGYLRRYIETRVAGIIGKGREVIGERKNGEQFPIYLSISDVRDAAGVFTGVVRDLTGQKRMQAKLVEQEALATLGRMSAVVAHEVKNPLAGIAGVIQILRSRLPEGSEEQDIMNEVLARIDALVETLQDILLFSRPREFRLAPVTVTGLMRETARLVESDPRTRGIEVSVPESDVEVTADVGYLREAFLNVLLNAAQAMGGNGVIKTGIRADGGHCEIQVIDSGPGVPEKVRSRVFEPFFTTKGRGTGLGLALVKRVVERHGGEVSLDCPPEGSTVVTLRLPVAATKRV
jgi:two-component system, LuxR family, sensor kinase FixL